MQLVQNLSSHDALEEFPCILLKWESWCSFSLQWYISQAVFCAEMCFHVLVFWLLHWLQEFSLKRAQCLAVTSCSCGVVINGGATKELDVPSALRVPAVLVEELCSAVLSNQPRLLLRNMTTQKWTRRRRECLFLPQPTCTTDLQFGNFLELCPNSNRCLEVILW